MIPFSIDTKMHIREIRHYCRWWHATNFYGKTLKNGRRRYRNIFKASRLGDYK